jgi:hypothetical protein
MTLLKRSVVGLAGMVAVVGLANAAPTLSWSEISEVTPNAAFDPNSGLTYNGTSFSSVASKISLGSLSASGPGTVTYTYLGKEAGFKNIFFAPSSTMQWQINVSGAPTVGATLAPVATPGGALSFKFEGDTGNYAVNGGAWSTYSSIGLIKDNYSGSLGSYDFIIGYNDSFSTHNDWDDMVIGVNFTAAVPEPETYALLLAGLGLLGFAARRRKLKAAAA